MANQARPTMEKEKPLKRAEIADDEMEEVEKIEKVGISKYGSLYNRIAMLMEKFASNRLGQMVIRKTDRVLKVIEDTAKWSLPPDDTDILYERPLPWIFFLTLIIWLRIFRIWLSVATYILGLEPITPHSIVYCIQTQRRRLGNIRFQGRQIETTVSYSSNKNVTSMEKLRKLFSSAICKPGLHREPSAKCVFAKDCQTVQDSTERPAEEFPNDDNDDGDDEDLNLTVNEMLDKYANLDSEDDADYMPEEDESDDDNNSTSHTSSFSAEDSEEESEKEMQKEILKNQEKDEEIKENGDTKQSKFEDFTSGFTENNITGDKDNEQGHTHGKISTNDSVNTEEVHTPKEILNKNTSFKEAEEALVTPVATTAFAPQPALNNTKTILNHLVIPGENKKKSTPGHESAAALKPLSLPTATTGSLQDIHSIFHPGSLINGATDEAKSSAPKESDHSKIFGSETTENTATNRQKKYFNSTHGKQNHHHNVKNRNKSHRLF